jgi:long-chain acyl-CoA synthetase
MYGATEFGGVAGWTLSDWRAHRNAKRGSVGRPNPGISVRVVHADTGAVLEPGQDGLLEVKGGQAGDEWVRTTDRARLDHDGFLWVLGRADDVIIRGGFKVSLTGLRDVLLTHPGVRDAVVIGVPHERLGQVPVAAVESPDGQVSASDLADHVARRLPRYQVPADIRVLAALPRTPSMKPDGVAVRALFDVAP